MELNHKLFWRIKIKSRDKACILLNSRKIFTNSMISFGSANKIKTLILDQPDLTIVLTANFRENAIEFDEVENHEKFLLWCSLRFWHLQFQMVFS